MLSFQDFFTACAGVWQTERTYHSVLTGEIERSHTEFRADNLDNLEKQRILTGSSDSSQQTTNANFSGIQIAIDRLIENPFSWFGFAISFATRSETGEEVAMSLKALFVPDEFVLTQPKDMKPMPLPVAAEVPLTPPGEVIQGFYLRDQGYYQPGAIAGRFTYQPTRQTLEMTTYYKNSVAVDQMRFVRPDLRLRTIVTYQRPEDDQIPASVVSLVGFGVEHKQP
ncbi:phycobiliprotein lyase [Leptolyngbya ohadii]|uniref:phycobiliprotein lyase n=1 Tax=Leptolyngbya ohadii TaxID=1962290 RepID=UPI000B59E684|nr:phycobiliprotein lyase [Leptolyngbya ohadii]